MPTRRITILEPAPCADTLFDIRQDPEEGYLSAADGTISLRSGSRLRPRVMGTYAGGKATNVARIIDALLNPDDPVQVELIVFRPDSPHGRYIAELQSTELSRVSSRSIIVDSTARVCINLSDPSSSTPVEFNISPRVVWQPAARQTALNLARGLETDLLLLAGNPPLMAPNSDAMNDLPVSIIDAVPGPPRLTVDIAGAALSRILQGPRHPDVIRINDQEYASIDKNDWTNYSGVLLVTDAAGCNLWETGPAGPCVRVKAAAVDKVYSTVGAGDAVHAAFTLAARVWGYDPLRAARYGVAAAAAVVSSPQGTRSITKEAVEQFFRTLAH
jgi:fructose-1-phosphate kinase PfkB-like protein